MLEPEKGYLKATDHITFPEAVDEVSFSLHAGLRLRLSTPGAWVTSVDDIESQAPLKHYRIRFSLGQKELQVHYSGKIQQRFKYSPGDYSGGRESSAGIISEQGVFLSQSSYWFPVFDDRPVTFSLSTLLPNGWSSISQGKSVGNNQWQQLSPQDDIYLIAGRYHIYRRSNDVAEAQVYLLQPDNAMAQRYLKATEGYLQLYSKLLGPYPYSKFAMVENIWETGYGMPSFTLLGSKVIRLPFILNSSYPHEILHNWWGNGVFIDYAKGNWAEGMTTYLADHLIKEQQAQGSQYRRDALQSYATYVTKQNEYTLKDFRGHHGQASQAIGYGKSMMILHMLRLSLGDDTFTEGLRLFYQDNLHKVASYDDMQRAFEQVSGKDLSTEFTQWTSRTGAPVLDITEISAKEDGWDYLLSFTLRQTQKDEPYLLHVPVYIQTEDESEPIVKTVTFKGRETRRTIELDERPLSIMVDPLFDVFRTLDPSETPSSLGQLFGAKEPIVILPSLTDVKSRMAYRRLANSWKQRFGNISIVWDNGITELPKDRAVWLLGRDNLFADQFMQDMGDLPVAFNDQTLRINGKQFDADKNSFVLTNRGSMTRGWLHAHSLAALPGLTRKIPHYGKYSYLVFTGGTPENILNGQWPLMKSTLSVRLDKEAPPIEIPEHPPLSELIE